MVRILCKLGREECMLHEFKIIRPTNLTRILEFFPFLLDVFPIFSDFFSIFSDEIKISSDKILNNVHWNRTNNVLFHQNDTLFLLKKSSDYQRTCSIPEKWSQNLYFQTLWESHNSQQLFLNSDLDVKWRNRGRENIPNRSLDSEQFLFDCWADAWLWVWRRSVLGREQIRNKMPTRKKKSDILLGNVALNMFSSCEDLSIYVLLLKHVVNTYFHATIKFSIESTSAVVLHFAYGTI